MEIILIEKHKKLGNIGDVVRVKDGFARNYLIPTKKALYASKDNKAMFEAQREEIQKQFTSKRVEAEKIKATIDSKYITLIKQAGEDNRLYGSVNSTDIVNAVKEQLQQELHRSAIQLMAQIKYIGIYDINVNIFSDVVANLRVVVDRSKEEAMLLLKKETDAKKVIATKKAIIGESVDGSAEIGYGAAADIENLKTAAPKKSAKAKKNFAEEEVDSIAEDSVKMEESIFEQDTSAEKGIAEATLSTTKSKKKIKEEKN